MKIEIAESLLYSYLIRIKKCLIAQMNWRVPYNYSNIDIFNSEVSRVFEKIKNSNEFAKIFGEQKLGQIIQQAEVDVIGIDNRDQVYFVDVAFHESGLNYGSKEETKERVVKKCLRAYLAALQLFPNKSYEILFVSPKTNNATEVEIANWFEILSNEFSNNRVSFQYYSNEKFENEVLINVVNTISKDGNTSELFVRAVKLFQTSDHANKRNKSTITKIDDEYSCLELTSDVWKRSQNESIQDYVKRVFEKLFTASKLAEDEIQNLHNEQYCRSKFGINFPLLLDIECDVEQKVKVRYWKKPIFFSKYYICSQWQVDKEKMYENKIIAWLKEIKAV